MTDDAGGDELPIIDVRSPAERATDAGSGGFDRMQAFTRAQPLSALATAWMVSSALFVGSESYQALNQSFGHSGWVKLFFLAQGSGLGFSLAAMVGLGLTALAERAPVAVLLGGLIGLWAIFTGGCGVVVAIHGIPQFGELLHNRFAFALESLSGIGLGVVVVFVAFMLLTRPPEVTAAG